MQCFRFRNCSVKLNSYASGVALKRIPPNWIYSMTIDLLFIFNSLLLGIGLAMDAFSVSIANGLADPFMSRPWMCTIAGTYSGFQFLMPMIGWLCVRTIAERFQAFQAFIPWIALILLVLIGIGMIRDSLSGSGQDSVQAAPARLGVSALLLQGIATSIDALSVGFTIADYPAPAALLCCVLIAVVTFAICIAGLLFGRRFGSRIAEKAGIIGGCILIGIGIEIWLTA